MASFRTSRYLKHARLATHRKKQYPQVPHSQQVDAHPGRENNHNPVYQRKKCQNGQNNEPEPQEDVDFLVDHVQGENTHGVVLLQVSGNTVLVERALGHPRKDLDHGVDPVFLVTVNKCYHVEAEHEEGTIEETVHQEHLP